MKENKDKVDAAIDKECKTKRIINVDQDEMVAVLNIKLPKFLNIPKSEDWNSVPNMIMNEDTTYDFTGFVFYQMEGEFKSYDDANVACRILFDGEEQLDSRAKVGNHLDFSLRGAFAAKFEADFH